MTRMLAAAPRFLDGLVDHPSRGIGSSRARLRFHQDVALLSQILLQFLDTHDLGGGRPLRVAGFDLRRRIYRSLRVLVDELDLGIWPPT